MHLAVKVLNRAHSRGWLQFGSFRMPCALGRAGIRAIKREGDGASPRGSFPLRGIFYNPSRTARPLAPLPVEAIRPDGGWCDAPQDRNYNRPVRHPYPASAERLWRDDHLYDLVVVIGHNDRPRVRGLGSAVFLHLARPGLAPTEGCVALRHADLRRLLARLQPTTRISIGL